MSGRVGLVLEVLLGERALDVLHALFVDLHVLLALQLND